MLLEKVYTETIDIRDPEDYCAHPETYAMTYLCRRFAGRCRGGAFIVKVLKILARSDCKMKETDLSAEGYVDVEFLALVSVVGQWDIVTGVKIANRGQQIANRGQQIVGRSETEGTMVVTLVPSPEAQAVREDQIVAIRVLRVHYSPDQPQATAVGPLLTCDRAAPVYAVAGRLVAEDARLLLSLVVRIKDLLAARWALMETRRDDVLFFEALLYSFAPPRPKPGEEAKTQSVETVGAHYWVGPGGYPLPAEAAAFNLLTVVEDAALMRTDGQPVVDARGTWSRDLTLYRSSPLATRVPPGEAPPPHWPPPVAATPRTAFTSMLITVYNFLKAINEMVQTYDTAALLESHKNIWRAMASAQLPAP